MLTLQKLLCNDQPEPLGIDDLRPYFGWQLVSPERGQFQTSYRLLVASTKELLSEERGDCWDTGQVHSDQSIQVRYRGRVLESRRRYYWMAKAWDAQGVESAWSSPAWFEMGLLDRDDWQAQWIADPDSSWEEIRPAPFLRKEIFLPEEVSQARVYICGLGYYELFLNGQRVGDHVLDPAFTRYDRRALYVTYDITDLLQQGENVFGVILGNGLYNQAARDAWYFEKAPWRGSPRLLFQAHLTFADGSQQVITSDNDWKVAAGPILFDATRLGEVYDARLELDGWNRPGFSDAGWKPVRIVEAPRGKLTAQSQPPMRITRTLSPVRLWRTPHGTTIFDLGQNFAGWVRLRLSGQAGTEVILRFGELITPDGCLDQSNINTLVYEGQVQVDRYILNGSGEEFFEPHFTFHGFQYVEVEGAVDELALTDMEGRVIHTDFAPAGQFRCANELVNRLQDSTVWSYISNFTGYPTDCPHREKNGWTGDTQLASEAGLYNFHAAPAYRKWLNDLADEQREDGSLPGIVPTSGWGYEWGNGPCWDSAAIIIPWYLYLYRGDSITLERCYPLMRRYIEYLYTRAHGGLVSFGLGDWLPPFGGPEDYTAPLTLLTTAYYYTDLTIMTRTARLLGHAEDSQRYQELSEQVCKAFNLRFYDPMTGLYAGGSQTALGMALWAGLVEAEERPKVARQLAAEIHQQKGRLNAGIHGAKAVPNALSENGFYKAAYDLITQPQYPGWVWWLEQGATSLWESWNGQDSHNHIAFGDISAWFFKYLAGIRLDPEQPGFKRVIIRPFIPPGLDWASGTYETPYGPVSSAWRRQLDPEERTGSQHLRLDVSLPPNTSAFVYLPKARPDSLRVNEQLPEEVPGLQMTHQRTGEVVLRCGSGDWQFDCELV